MLANQPSQIKYRQADPLQSRHSQGNQYRQPAQGPQNQQNPEKQNNKDPAQIPKTYPCAYFIISWVLFIVAAGIYFGVWAINKYACNFFQTSYYYRTDHTISPYVLPTNSTISTSSQLDTSYATDSALTVSMSLLYTWILWKGPIIAFAYAIIQIQQNKIIRFVTLAIQVVLLLAADICLVVFLQQYYEYWMYFGLFMVLTTIIAIINNAIGGKSSCLKGLKSALIPLLLIAFYYTCHTFLLPRLYNLEAVTGSTAGFDGIFIWVYSYPFLDFLLYGILLVSNHFLSEQKEAHSFISMVHYQLVGYGVGMILIINYTEVEFYYILGYFIFRNVFFNWVVWKFDKVVNNPAALPGWGLIYYASFLLNYVPVIGIGKIVVSNSYFTMQYSKATTILYGIYNQNYLYTTYADTEFNFSFIGNIMWIAGAVIWVGMTFSQKYSRRKPEWKDLFYYLCGIYLFYLGLSSALNLVSLASNSLP